MMVVDTYLFLSISDCIMITIKINQLVIIVILHHFVVIRSISFQLKVYYYFDTILEILTNLNVFCILSTATKLRFTRFLFCFVDNLKIYKCYSRVESKFELESG